MSSVNCDSEDKARFDEFMNEDEGHSEAFKRLLDQAEAFEGELIDEKEVAEETAELMGPKLELVMYRLLDELGEE